MDVRVIAATNLNLTEAIAHERFRQDLFFRLNRILITVPPLRQRQGDIPLLVDHFINLYNRRNGKMIKGISKSALRLLEDYRFPGNVRELENLIASAIVLEEGEVIRATTIRPRLVLADAETSLALEDMPYKEAKENFERLYFSQLLQLCHYNVSQTARLAQMDRSHVITKLKALDIKDTKRSE